MIEEIGTLRARNGELQLLVQQLQEKGTMVWTPETVEKTLKARWAELEQVEKEPEGSILPCRYGGPGFRHPAFCMCGGTGTMTREELIEDLKCDIEILHK
jgi:hypothetical protein